MKTNQQISGIPLVPKEITRVNVAVDRKLYLRAKELGIDVHTLWRLKLQEAVALIEVVNEDVTDLGGFLANEIKKEDEYCPPPRRSSERIVNAVAQAKQPYPWPDKR